MAKKHVTAFDFPADNTVAGRELQSVEQGAIQEQRLNQQGYTRGIGPHAPYDYGEETCKVDNRKTRGGAIFTEKQMMSRFPRDPDKERQ